MTAALHPAPLSPLRWLCPRCDRLTELRGGATRLTALGIERERKCLTCGAPYETIEQPKRATRTATLVVPAMTPTWALRAAEFVARVGNWIGGRR